MNTTKISEAVEVGTTHIDGTNKANHYIMVNGKRVGGSWGRYENAEREAETTAHAIHANLARSLRRAAQEQTEHWTLLAKGHADSEAAWKYMDTLDECFQFHFERACRALGDEAAQEVVRVARREARG